MTTLALRNRLDRGYNLFSWQRWGVLLVPLAQRSRGLADPEAFAQQVSCKACRLIVVLAFGDPDV